VYERIILKLILTKCDGRVWDGFLFFFLRRTPITSYELGDEPSGSIKGIALATSLVTVSFLTEVVMHGINLIIHKASSFFNEQNYVFRLLGNVYNNISALE